MQARNYWAAMDRLTERNRLLGVAVIVMLLFNGMNWFALAKAKAHQQVALVPIAGGSGMWVGAGQASPEYLRAMARYITYQVGNYTAATLRPQLQELLTLFPPDRIGEVQVEFERLATQVERYPSISSSILWAGRDPLKVSDHVLQVQARKSRLVNGNVTKTEQIFYCIDYVIAETQFWINSISEKGGDGEDLCFVSQRQNVEAPPAQPGTGGTRTGGE